MLRIPRDLILQVTDGRERFIGLRSSRGGPQNRKPRCIGSVRKRKYVKEVSARIISDSRRSRVARHC